MKNWISKTLSEGRKRPCERFFFGLDKYSTAPEERATEAHSGSQRHSRIKYPYSAGLMISAGYQIEACAAYPSPIQGLSKQAKQLNLRLTTGL